jgi:arabinogalactan oligomer/maltooligosaccharide transport system substrate-binding protein
MLRVALPPLLLLLLALSLAACPRRPPPEEANTVLTLWHTFNPEETATLNQVLQRVQRSHPAWRVQVTVIPFARAQNEFRRAAQRCEPGAPDVFRAELPWLGEYVSKRLIRAVPADAPAEAALLPQARQAARYRGQRWALPASLDCLALLYNRALLDRPPATVRALIAEAQRLTVDATGRNAANPGFDATRATRWGFYVRPDAYWFLPFLWAEGGQLLDPDAGKVYIDQPPAVAALQLYSDLMRVYKIAPPRPSPSDDYEDQMRRFAAGEVAMIVNGPWAISGLLGQRAFKEPTRLGIAPFPRGASGAPAAPLSGHGFVVSSCARDVRAAWQLAAALSDEEAQAQFAQANSLLPALRSTYERGAVRASRTIAGFRDALTQSRLRPQHPAIARIFDDFTPAVQAVLLGDASPAEALAGVARAWRRLLASSPGPHEAPPGSPSPSSAPAASAP